jgi:hypothetical protein
LEEYVDKVTDWFEECLKDLRRLIQEMGGPRTSDEQGGSKEAS